jgi:hypothetical protein
MRDGRGGRTSEVRGRGTLDGSVVQAPLDGSVAGVLDGSVVQAPRTGEDVRAARDADGRPQVRAVFSQPR